MNRIARFFLIFIITLAALLYFFQYAVKEDLPEVSRVSEQVGSPKENATQQSKSAAAPGKPATHYHAYQYSTESYPREAAPTNSDQTSETDTKTSEQLLKYVLFSVKYDPKINAGETESLLLSMSPRNKLRNLERALQENKIKHNQINDIEKIQSQYKYVSAKLLSQNNCLQIEKKMPEEDKVYLPSINESSGDQIWQWDLTAPHAPLTTVCHLSLFIRFCLNQNDCVPLADPDKEFNIYIEITFTHRIYTWLSKFGNLAASIIIPILTVIGIIGGYIWRKKSQRSNNKNADSS